jgi:hypothetical protein
MNFWGETISSSLRRPRTTWFVLTVSIIVVVGCPGGFALDPLHDLERPVNGRHDLVYVLPNLARRRRVTRDAGLGLFVQAADPGRLRHEIAQRCSGAFRTTVNVIFLNGNIPKSNLLGSRTDGQR